MSFRLAAVILGLLLGSRGASLACSVCYGEPGSPAAEGLTWAIVALGVIIACVLAAVVGFFVHSNRRMQMVAGADHRTEGAGKEIGEFAGEMQ